MKKLLISLLALLPFGLMGQMLEPIKWTSDFKIDGTNATLTLTASMTTVGTFMPPNCRNWSSAPM